MLEPLLPFLMRNAHIKALCVWTLFSCVVVLVGVFVYRFLNKEPLEKILLKHSKEENERMAELSEKQLQVFDKFLSRVENPQVSVELLEQKKNPELPEKTEEQQKEEEFFKLSEKIDI